MTNLNDLLNQYDWREAISVGIGSVAGAVHAVYDKTKGNRAESSNKFTAGISAFSGGFMAHYGAARGIGNGILSGLTYNLAYHGTYKLLNAISKKKTKSYLIED